jgi:hypothetical protein
VTVNTVLISAVDLIIFSIIIMRVVSALVYADFAAYALLLITFHNEFRFYVTLHFLTLAATISMGFMVSSLPMTGSPPRGLQTLSKFEATSWMADSSEDK